MQVVKANLPDGVKKKFIVKIGKKVKLINKKDWSRKKAKERAKKAAKASQN